MLLKAHVIGRGAEAHQRLEDSKGRDHPTRRLIAMDHLQEAMDQQLAMDVAEADTDCVTVPRCMT